MSGVAHAAFENEIECLERTRDLIDFLPLNWKTKSPIFETKDDRNREIKNLTDLVPTNSNHPYDMKTIIKTIVDENNFFEIMEDYAKNIITGFARMEGQTVAIIANQTLEKAGKYEILIIR